MARYAIIGGTGVYDPHILSGVRDETVATPYGEVGLKVGTYQGREVAFLPRHGAQHSVPPHLINYRANIWALRRFGVERVIATTAVGGINPAMRPGDLVFCDQFLDFTRRREDTFFTGGEGGVVHTDFTEPYCLVLRDHLAGAAERLGFRHHTRGTYVCVEGPRFETPAEIRMYRLLGADVTGMTGVPEVVLAREAGLCYATVSMITNYAAGMTENPLTHEEVLEVMRNNMERLKQLVMATLEAVPDARDCRCGETAGGLQV